MDYLSAVSSSIRSDRRLRRRPRSASLFHSPLSPTISPTQVASENLYSLQLRRGVSQEVSLYASQLPSQTTSAPSVLDKQPLRPAQLGSTSTLTQQRLGSEDGALKCHATCQRSNAFERRYSSFRQTPPRPACHPSISAGLRNPPVRIVVTAPQSPEHHRVSGARYIPKPLTGTAVLPFHEELDDKIRASHVHSHKRRPPDQWMSTTFDRRARRRQNSAVRSSGSLNNTIEAESTGEMDRAKSPPIDPQTMRLRSLNAEVNLLRMELAEWKSKFEERMAEATISMNDGDSAWRDRAQRLDSELKANRLKIRELEFENEMQARRLRDAEALSHTNRNLERRIDVLTELLAQSPTSPSQLPSVTSPGSNREPWSPSSRGSRLARPKSMLSYMPVSPAVENDSFQPLVVPEKSTAQRGVIQQDLAVAVTDCVKDRRRWPKLERTAAQGLPDLSLADSHSETSASGLTTLKSQRSSMTSQSSLASAWSLPFPFSPDDPASKERRPHPRKMRHFPSGSCTLKPLILPVAAANLPDHPFSPPACTRLTAMSEPPSSLDPTTAFLDEEVYENVQTHAGHDTWAQRESLDALEGRTRCYQSFEAALTDHTAVAHGFHTKPREIYGLGLEVMDSGVMKSTTSMGQIPETTDFARFDGSARISGSPSIVDELSPSDSEAPSFSHAALPKPIYDYCAKPPKRPQLCSAAMYSMQVHTTKAMNGTPAIGKRSPSVGPRPVPTVSILTTYSNYVETLPQGPVALLRRMLQRAKGSSLGKLWDLPWWLLGIFLRPKFRDKPVHKPRSVEADNYDWHRFSVASYQAVSAPYTAHLEPVDASSIQTLGGNDEDDAAAVLPRLYSEKDPDDPPEVNPVNESPPISRSVYWWTRFSLAIVLAVRIAVRDGPQTLLERSRPTGCCHRCRNRPKYVPRAALTGGRAEALHEQLDDERHSAWTPILSLGGFTID